MFGSQMSAEEQYQQRQMQLQIQQQQRLTAIGGIPQQQHIQHSQYSQAMMPQMMPQVMPQVMPQMGFWNAMTKPVVATVPTPTAATAVVTPVADLHSTVFFANIPPETSESQIEALFATCGSIKTLRRLQNIDGTYTHYGFCIFNEPSAAWRCWKALEQHRGIVVKVDATVESNEDSKAEANLMQALEPIVTGITNQQDVKTEEMDPMETEEEESERIEEEKLLKGNKRLFDEKLSRFELNEQARLRRITADTESDLQDEVRMNKTSEYLKKRLGEFDDDAEKQKMDEEYYRDRPRWLARRERDRLREQNMDERDRLAEKEEKQSARLTAKLPTSTTSGFVVSRIMTKDEREAAIAQLVAAIPATKQGLWTYSIKWSFLDNTIVDSKLGPFLKTKIAEFIGEEDAVLFQFVLDKIRSHSSAQSILDELLPVLDDEAEPFVMRLWHMVIYETEERAQGL